MKDGLKTLVAVQENKSGLLYGNLEFLSRSRLLVGGHAMRYCQHG